MERKVHRAQGDRTQDELKVLYKEIDVLKQSLNYEEQNFSSLCKSNKQLIDEISTLERLVTKVNVDMDHLKTQIQELELENQMSISDLEKIKKRKEETLVQHDIMKLEIKKLRETVNVEADSVFGLENMKYQLEMSMEE